MRNTEEGRGQIKQNQKDVYHTGLANMFILVFPKDVMEKPSKLFGPTQHKLRENSSQLR